MVFQQFQGLEANEIKLQAVADVASAVPISQFFKAVPPGFSKQIVMLAIDKSNESRPEDVGDILLNFSRINLEQPLRNQVLKKYKPPFDQHSKDISPENWSEILQLYHENFQAQPCPTENYSYQHAIPAFSNQPYPYWHAQDYYYAMPGFSTEAYPYPYGQVYDYEMPGFFTEAYYSHPAGHRHF